MKDFLQALGRPVTLSSMIQTLAPIKIIAVSLLLVRFTLNCELPYLSLPIHICIWGGWLYWQSVVFEQTRRHMITKDADSAYEQVFRRQITPGLAFWIAQVTAPLVIAHAHGDTLCFSCGLVAAVAGALLLALSFATIGIAHAAFAAEYRRIPKHRFNSGPYRFAIHPMFVAGLAVSAGLALCCAPDCTGIGMALTNGVVTCIYNVTERKRFNEIRYFDLSRKLSGGFKRLDEMISLVRSGTMGRTH